MFGHLLVQLHVVNARFTLSHEQTHFENIMTEGETAHDDQLFLLLLHFQPYKIAKLSSSCSHCCHYVFEVTRFRFMVRGDVLKSLSCRETMSVRL